MEYFVILTTAIFISIVFGYWQWRLRGSCKAANEWAARNGYEVLHCEHRSLRKGPFWWDSSTMQTIYYLVLQDKTGARRTAWLRIGDWWSGLAFDEIKVKWEEA